MSSHQLFSLSGLLFVLIALVPLILKYQKKNGKPALPPGPKGLPLVGNIFDFPVPGKAPFTHWIKHKDTFGPISSVTVMGQVLILLHDQEAANIIMGKKTQKTSSRPTLNFANICGYENYITSHKYDDKYRMHRKMIKQNIGSKGLVSQFESVQASETLQFVIQAMRYPDRLFELLAT